MDFYVIVVNYNSDKYIQSLYDSLRKTSDLPFHYEICDNGSSDSSKSFLQKFSVQNPNVSLHYRQQTDELPSSRHHAAAVDLILSTIPDNRYCLIIDVDCYMFAQKWQQMFIEMLETQKKDCISTARVISMNGKDVKRAIPYMTFFKSDLIRQKNISFMPDIKQTLAGNKGYDFGYRLNDCCSVEYVDMVIPAPTLAGLPKPLVEKSMDFVYNGFLIAQHMKMGGRGFKAEFYDLWLSRCKSVGKKLLKGGHEYVRS